MDTLSAEDIRALARAGESQTVEFKLETETQPDVGELLTSFANADGGIVLFGVTDAGEIVGLRRPHVVRNRLLAAARACHPPLGAYLTSYLVDVDGRQVLVGQLPAGGDQVYSYGPVYRRREGADNIILSAEQLKHLIRRRMSQDFDGQPLELDLAALDAERVDRFLAQRAELARLQGAPVPAPPPHPSVEAVEQLAALRAVAQVRDVYRPTVAGVLMLGRDPQQALPQATIRAAAFADDGAMSFLDRAEITGPLPEQLQRALAFVARNTRLGAVIAGAERIEHPQYPPVAVREGVVNALLHRSYAEQSPVLLHIFPTRLEILSPGGLLPGLEPDHLEGKHVLRNHVLGPLAYFARLAETWGTGILRIRATLTEAGLPLPEFHDEKTWLRLTFYSPDHLATRVARAPQVEAPAPSGPAELPSDLNSRQRDLLTEWERTGGGEIRRAEYEARYGVSGPTAGRDLQELVQHGLVQRGGQGPETVYRYTLRRQAGRSRGTGPNSGE